MRRFSKWVGENLGRLDREAKPFMASYEMASVRQADHIDVAKFAGLVAVHVFADADRPHLISYWKSREDFARSGALLNDAIEGFQNATGYIVHFQEARRPLVKRVAWYTLLATVLAVLGAIDTMRSQWARLAAKPRVQTSWRMAGNFNYQLGDTIVEPLAVTNRRAVTHTVKVASAVLKNADATPSEFRVSHPPGTIEVPENQTEEVEFRANVTRAGIYELAGELDVQAGRFADPAPTPFSLKLQVWDPEPEISRLHVSRQQTDACELAGDLLLGQPAPDGIACTVRIDQHAELTDVFPLSPSPIDVHESKEWSVNGDIGSVKFVLEPVQPMRPHPFLLELTTARQANCDALRSSTRIRCRPYRQEQKQ